MERYGHEQASGNKATLPTTIAEVGRSLRSGSLTAEALVEVCLRRIEVLEPKLNAFIKVTADQALATATELDAELRAGRDRGPLHGIPIVYKDLYDVAGVPTTVGSRFFEKSEPKPRDAAIVRSLKSAGVVSLGKTNMDEFAAGGSGKNIFYGDTHNPWALSCAPGGSSGGTAAAVASGICLGGIGSDTGGSVRCPASLCGIVGIRPTVGLVSLAGAYPRAYSLDAPGPLARTVADASLLLEAMVGDGKDGNQSFESRYTAGLHEGVRGIRLGIVRNFTFRDIDPEVATAMRAAVEKLSSLGAEIVEIPLPASILNYSELLDVLLYEFNQILGDRYRAARDKDVFGPVVQNNLERGMNVSQKRYEEVLAQRPKQTLEVKKAFERVDALLTPTQPMIAPSLGAGAEAFDRMRQFLLPTSFIGLPSVSVPCGFSSKGLPIGLHIIGDHLEEALILRVASAFEAATDFHRHRPPVCDDLRG